MVYICKIYRQCKTDTRLWPMSCIHHWRFHGRVDWKALSWPFVSELGPTITGIYDSVLQRNSRALVPSTGGRWAEQEFERWMHCLLGPYVICHFPTYRLKMKGHSVERISTQRTKRSTRATRWSGQVIRIIGTDPRYDPDHYQSLILCLKTCPVVIPIAAKIYARFPCHNGYSIYGNTFKTFWVILSTHKHAHERTQREKQTNIHTQKPLSIVQSISFAEDDSREFNLFDFNKRRISRCARDVIARLMTRRRWCAARCRQTDEIDDDVGGPRQTGAGGVWDGTMWQGRPTVLSRGTGSLITHCQTEPSTTRVQAGGYTAASVLVVEKRQILLDTAGH